MNNQNNIAIVIPCYNEARTLDLDAYKVFFAANPAIFFCFVNDGSTDDTLGCLNELKSASVIILNLDKNGGKAEAVRAGINLMLDKKTFSHIAFLDADLSTPLGEISHLQNEFLINSKLEMVFGSRILKIGSRIDRKLSRFIIGRTIATFISKTLKLKVYDTQCGAKLFTADLANQIFNEKFISRWLFDVELMFRVLKLYGREKGEQVMKEVPLNIWEEKGNSKLKWTYGFKVFFDLFKIKKKYKGI